MIVLNDILQLSQDEISHTKIRLNKTNRIDYNPRELFKDRDEGLYRGHFWNGKTKHFREGQLVIGLLQIGSDKWLLFDVSRITKDLGVLQGMGYEYEPVESMRKYFGRVIVAYKNTSQQMVRRGEGLLGELVVDEIISDRYDGYDFPGYENVDVSWRELERAIDQYDWQTALQNQKGVYLITDDHTGKRYVGSAYGEDMLLGRWRNYIRTGHGGNKGLKPLDLSYIQSHFRYAILDIYKAATEDAVIIRREHHWMKVLLTKDQRFGYNH